MAKKLPGLPDTGRRYVEATRGARLANQGVERYVRPRPQIWSWIAAAVIAIALVAAMVILS